MNTKFAKILLNKTRDDYNLIGHDFSSKRAYISPDVQALKKYAAPRDKILDLGCGNGRLSEIFSDLNVEYVGVDISEVMVEIARQKYPNQKFELIDFLHLPFPDNSFDKVYCLSVLHHIPSVEFRRQFLQEAKRVLKPQGKLILTVWNLLIKRQVIFSVIKNAALRLIGLSPLDFKDIYLSFSRSKEEKLADRYLHVFSMKELVGLISSAGMQILESGRQTRGKKVANENLYTIAIKN